MLVNDIKKGMRVKLKNGWYGTMYDNKKGTSRTVEVEGYFTEIGSVYSRDITSVIVNGTWEAVTLSAAQHKSALRVSAAGF